MELLPLYFSAFLLGTAHAIEPDHVAAVTAFVVRRPHPLQAAGFGVRWALGHGSAIFLVGVALLLVGTVVPTAWTDTLDRIVGLAMILLGVWAVANARALHAHEHTHADGTHHTHLHHHGGPRTGDHAHRHAATAFGMLHGLAGTGPAVALIPLISLRSTGQGALYLFLFGLGTALGMGSYALIAGAVATRIGAVSEKLGRSLAMASGLFAICVGVIWVLR